MSLRPELVVAGRLGEGLDTLERARGHLYAFHQLIGAADAVLDDVLAALEAAGEDGLAAQVRRRLYGLDVLPGMWTYQVLLAFDGGFYREWQDVERVVREALAGGARHAAEAAMKDDRQARGVLGPDAG